MSETIRLNLCCGDNKIPGFRNVDINPLVKPDESWNVLKPWPVEEGTVDEIVLYHAIEHIPKSLHDFIFISAFRVLKVGGIFRFSYPEFEKIIKKWLEDPANREWWEATIYGRQRDMYDYHVAAMNTQEVIGLLESCGFGNIRWKPEDPEDFNTVIQAMKMDLPSYEEELMLSCQV